MPERPVTWVGNALDELRQFPLEARRAAGHQLHLVQIGVEPSDWKPMPVIGPGVRELRIHTGRAFRVIYLASYQDAVYVLSAFEKKSGRTSKLDIELARKRLRDLDRTQTRE